MFGSIHNIISSTLITLIPKNAEADSFQDFRPISLCNILFKIISKIIAERLKSTLASFITKDQHAFLKGHNNLDAVAITQESLFSMISRKTNAAILKIDLQKAYNCLDWELLRCLLAKIGLKSHSINWVMSCVENVRYPIIINGMPSPFFSAERGLRQGCSLSPLLFILAMNSLSLQINKAVDEKRCRPVRVCRDIYLSHNLFVDDILIFAMLCRATWIRLNGILDRFQKATGLVINKAKSTIFHNDTSMVMVSWIAELLGIAPSPLKDGLKYLGFQLKTKGYSIADWQWLLERFYKKISGWKFKSLSLTGRLILTQAVLAQLAVYWAHIVFLPTSIINKMNRLSTNFLWGGKSNQSKIHLSKLNKISMPKKIGGWGLLDMQSFGRALLCKSLWRGVFGDGLWSHFIRKKYMQDKDLEFWYRRRSIRIRHGFAIWLSLKKVQQYFLQNLRWNLFTGARILIGINPIDKLISSWSGPIPLWKDGHDLLMPGPLLPVWNSVKVALCSLGIHRSGTFDHLIWTVPNAKMPVRVKDIYVDMISSKASRSYPLYPPCLWKSGCPLKMILFSWLVFNNINLSWENLRKRSWHGPSRCAMCEAEEEPNLHMFFQCNSSLRI
eukprot:PITA_17832